MNRLYDVFDGSTRLAGDVELDIALCLIRGYAEAHSNKGLSILIQESSSKQTSPIQEFMKKDY